MSRDFPAGTNDWLDAGDPAALDITGAGAITIAAWIQLDTNNVAHPIIYKGGSAAGATQYATYIGATGKLTCLLGDATANSFKEGLTTLSTGVWHHTVGRRTASGDYTVYLNGVADAAVTNTTRVIQNTAHPLRLGARAIATQAWMDGRIAEAAVWDIALNEDEIMALVKGVCPLLVRPGPSLKGYWPVLGAALPEIDLSEWSNEASTPGSLPAVAYHCPAGPYVLN